MDKQNRELTSNVNTSMCPLKFQSVGWKEGVPGKKQDKHIPK
jgi:hypothetical protein